MASATGDKTLSNGMPACKFKRVYSQPENPFAALIPDQTIAIVPSYTLESGVTLYNVPVAYSTRGTLSPDGDNAMVICHALTGSADVSDWWGPLLGPGRAFDITRFFIICINSLGSPYGSASPMTYKHGDPEQGRYGPEFPLTTIRDDVGIFKMLLDDLGVRQIATVIGGSMGGMLVLEFAYFGAEYVRSIIPMATSARHSAWCISWGEAQRQSIYSDPKYDDGYYPLEDPPSTGLGAARMAALLTYRSRDSFESRFGRNTPDARWQQSATTNGTTTPDHDHWAIHNEGHKNAGSPRSSSRPSPSHPSPSATISSAAILRLPALVDPQFHGTTPLRPDTTTTPRDRGSDSDSNSSNKRASATTYFSAQSYLRHQAQKFIRRFDANCYISITRKLDTHDVSRLRPGSSSFPLCPSSPGTSSDSIATALSLITQPTLILGIESDGLFTFAEQKQLASYIPHARLERIESPEGHDAFLLQFEQVNRYILGFLGGVLPDLMGRRQSQGRGNGVGAEGGKEDGEGVNGVNGVSGDGEWEGADGEGEGGGGGGGVGRVVKSSMFGEAEAEVEDITAW